MFTQPLSKQSIYLTTTLFSLLTTSVTFLFTTNFLVLIVVFTAPFVYSALQVRHARTEALTPREKALAEHTPMVFWKYLAGGVILIGLLTVTTNAPLVFIVGVVILGTSSLPMRAIHHWFYQPYEEIEFGFRDVLPAAPHWMGMFIVLWNAQHATHTYTQQLWYWIAAKRTDTLLAELPKDSPYAKRSTASQYKNAFYEHSQTGNQIDTRSTFDALLTNLSKLYCQKCEQQKPVDELYLLTNEGVLTEAYCIECLQHENTEESETQGSTTQSERTPQETRPDDLQNALKVFNFNTETTTLTEDAIDARYRDLVKETHPDTGGSQEAFTEVKTAYETLQEYYL